MLEIFQLQVRNADIKGDFCEVSDGYEEYFRNQKKVDFAIKQQRT